MFSFHPSVFVFPGLDSQSQLGKQNIPDVLFCCSFLQMQGLGRYSQTSWEIKSLQLTQTSGSSWGFLPFVYVYPKGIEAPWWHPDWIHCNYSTYRKTDTLTLYAECCWHTNCFPCWLYSMLTVSNSLLYPYTFFYSAETIFATNNICAYFHILDTLNTSSIWYFIKMM